MTKARDPSTFEDAILRIVDRIGWAAAADAVGKGERVVRNWSDPDMDRQPTIDEAMALDAAYLSAGGGEPPLMAVYGRRLDRMVQAPSDAAVLVRASQAAAVEAGQAIAALMAASQPGASPRDIAAADKETEEAIEALTEAHRHLGNRVQLKAVS